MHGREVGTFEQSDQEAICHHLRVTRSPVLEQCEQTPGYVERRDEVVHTDFRKEECEGQLSEDCSEGVDCLEVDEFIAVEVEIFGEARDVGVV